MEHLLMKLLDQTFSNNNTWICFFKTGISNSNYKYQSGATVGIPLLNIKNKGDQIFGQGKPT